MATLPSMCRWCKWCKYGTMTITPMEVVHRKLNHFLFLGWREISAQCPDECYSAGHVAAGIGTMVIGPTPPGTGVIAEATWQGHTVSLLPSSFATGRCSGQIGSKTGRVWSKRWTFSALFGSIWVVLWHVVCSASLLASSVSHVFLGHWENHGMDQILHQLVTIGKSRD